MSVKWSYSADGTRRRCQRQLAYNQVVASHNARDSLRREVYVLKQVQQVRAWQGSLVHGVLATTFLGWLRVRQQPDPAVLTALAVARARRQFAFSAAQRYRQPTSKASAGDDYGALFEHEFGSTLAVSDLGRVEENIATAFRNLVSQRELLAELYGGWNQRSEWPLRLVQGGMAVSANLDLISLRQRGEPTIVDWKVSESESSDYARQLQVYAWALIRSGGWPQERAEQLNLYEVNLLKNLVHKHPFDADRLAETEGFVDEGIAALRAVLGEGRYEADLLARLPIAEQEQACRYCPYQRLCPQQLSAEGRPQEAQIVLERVAGG